MSSQLRASVIVDYQNVHLVGHAMFGGRLPKHETLVDPGLFAQQVIGERNRRQREGHPSAVLRRVLVFRGQPGQQEDPDDYARSLSQKAHWQRDRRVDVTLRPLKYDYERDEDRRFVYDEQGAKIVIGKREKGVDVLCALAAIREARDSGTDLVIMASTDSDLAPAIDEVVESGLAKAETVSWYDAATKRSQVLRSGAYRVWNTQITDRHFIASRDLTAY